MNLIENRVPLIVGKPDDLKWAVSFDSSRRNRCKCLRRAGSTCEARGYFIHDEIGVGFIALEGHPDHHLAQRGAGQ